MKTMRRRSKQLTTSRNVSRSYGERALVRVSRRGEIEAFLRKGLSVIREGVLLHEKKIRLETGVQQVLGAFSVQKEEGEKKQNNKMMMGKYYLGEGFQRWECPVWSPLHGW
jgi:hypothetical protein